MKRSTTKRALWLSVVSMFLCLTMFMGTTFAWFTDEVTSGTNTIVAGNLDIELDYWNGSAWKTVQGASDILTNELWEPGATEVAYLRLKNAGNLALKYQLGVNIVSETKGTNQAGVEFLLSDYIQFGVVENVNGETGAYPKDAAGRAAAIAAISQPKKISAGYTKANSLEANAAPLYFALVVYMPTDVDNAANHLTSDDPTNPDKYRPEIDLGINVVATQMTSEEDSFGKDYDVDAEYPIVVVNSKEENEELDLDAGNVAVTVPATAPAGDYVLNVSNKTIETDATSGTTEVSYNIDILKDGVKVEANGTIAYEVTIFVGKGLQIAAVNHNGNAIASYHYDTDAGTVTFTTTSFSPFSVVYKNVVDTAEGLQTAINNAEDGTLITINAGEYVLTKQIVVSNKSVTIVGNGDVKLIADHYERVFQLVNKGTSEKANADMKVTIKNVDIDGVDNKQYKYGILVRNDVDLDLENVTIAGNCKFGYLQAENYYDDECADFVANINAKNVVAPRITMAAGAGHTTNFTYEDCTFDVLEAQNLGGDVYINGEKAATPSYTYVVATSDELVEKINTAADGSTIILKAGEYAVKFTNNTAFNVDNLTIVGEDGAKLSVSSSEVWYGRVQGDVVTFENIHFTSSVGATGEATYNNCTFDDWAICASSNNDLTYFNNCTINGCLNTSVDFSSGNVYVKDSTVVKAEYSGSATMSFENCTIGELISWDMNTVLKNCTVTTIVTEHMSDNGITSVNAGEDGLLYATTTADEDALILYSVPSDYAETTLNVAEGVTDLCNGVFGGTAIETVTIPASVTDFGASGVSDTNASGGAFKGSNVTTVVLEEGMTEIPAAAFNGAKNLTSVQIPSSVKTIGVNAFRSTAITNLTIPATVETINYGAFRDMTSLETVTFEGEHVDVPNYAFRGCTNLRTVYLNVNTATIGTNMAFCNSSSNNPNTNNITFYCRTTDIADQVKASMGVGSYVAIYVGDTLYAEIK